MSIRKTAFAVAIVVMTTTGLAQAQTWKEWFSQKKTQKKYLLQQIAALQVYLDYAKKGYDIASSGIHAIRDISNGEFNLHNSFISSLKTVSPALRRNSKVADIIAMQAEISTAFRSIDKSSYLSFPLRQYIGDVREKVMDECWIDLDELLLVITSGRIEMGDSERLGRLDRIYFAMQDKSAFVQSFSNEVSMLLLQKRNEIGSIERLRRLYENDY